MEVGGRTESPGERKDKEVFGIKRRAWNWGEEGMNSEDRKNVDDWKEEYEGWRERGKKISRRY